MDSYLVLKLILFVSARTSKFKNSLIMKWIHEAIIIFYSIIALYFLYLASTGIFVYFANKSMGHQESFLIPGRNLCIGLLLVTITWSAWYFINQSSYSKLGLIILYLPLIIVVSFLIFMFINLISAGGKWN